MALGHYFDEDNIITEGAGCAEGSRYIKCIRCTEKIVLEAENHVFFTLYDMVLPSCDKAGHTEVLYCVNCGFRTGGIEIPAIGHIDTDEDGICDICSSYNYTEKDYCSCMCHNDSGIMKIFFKIAVFFWKLLKINYSCKCGTVHY